MGELPPTPWWVYPLSVFIFGALIFMIIGVGAEFLAEVFTRRK